MQLNRHPPVHGHPGQHQAQAWQRRRRRVLRLLRLRGHQVWTKTLIDSGGNFDGFIEQHFIGFLFFNMLAGIPPSARYRHSRNLSSRLEKCSFLVLPLICCIIQLLKLPPLPIFNRNQHLCPFLPQVTFKCDVLPETALWDLARNIQAGFLAMMESYCYCTVTFSYSCFGN